MNSFSESFSRLAKLESFNPDAFYPDKNISKEVCSFVLTLALIYNDIKNLALIVEILTKSKPLGSFEVRKDWGEYNGIGIYLNRLQIGILHELFKLIKKNKNVLDDSVFKEVINSIRKSAKKSWKALVDASFIKYDDDKLAKDLMFIRNKISFHYDKKFINDGYNYFYKVTKILKRAYISRGNQMEESRFYFADAAAENCIVKQYTPLNADEFTKMIRENLQKLNEAVWFIVTSFIIKRGFAFKDER